MMEISIKSYGKEHIARVPDDATIDEVLESIAALLIGATYQPKSIIKGMQYYIDEHSENSSNK